MNSLILCSRDFGEAGMCDAGISPEGGCKCCSDNSRIHDFSKSCCVSRFILAQPTRVARVTWLDKIRKEHGNEFAATVEADVISKWEKAKGLARSIA